MIWHKVVNSLTSSSLWKIKFLVEDLISSGGVIGKDFIANSGEVTITGYYDIEDCVAVKGTTNIYRCDNLKIYDLN